MIPFELFNALTSFYDYLNKVLAKKLDIFIIVYLDNIFIYKKQKPKIFNFRFFIAKQIEKTQALCLPKKVLFL